MFFSFPPATATPKSLYIYICFPTEIFSRETNGNILTFAKYFDYFERSQLLKKVSYDRIILGAYRLGDGISLDV